METPANHSNSSDMNQQIALPNSNLVLILGIGSIILCWCDGIVGLIMSIIALVFANRDLALYYANPGKYTQKSFDNIKTGRTVAIIGLVIAAVFTFVLIISIFLLGLNFALMPWEMIN